ncbi:hypothetical Protein YC6258_00737 [Gynuella sunshinyii YC6258]|uniref:Uncharacterized protein n=1 Tax=Gynuella sunshinyii YC6258 TaxID=1445510 RepID=A0A0C5VE56_9GAMM|nr:hypothetical Protein YC6258_00737 [Gynuella sunshinyii YC6258]
MVVDEYWRNYCLVFRTKKAASAAFSLSLRLSLHQYKPDI